MEESKDIISDNTEDFILMQRFNTFYPTSGTPPLTTIKAIADSLKISKYKVKKVIRNAQNSLRPEIPAIQNTFELPNTDGTRTQIQNLKAAIATLAVELEILMR